MAQAYATTSSAVSLPSLGWPRAAAGRLGGALGQRLDLAFRARAARPSHAAVTARRLSGPMLRELLVSEALHALGIPPPGC